MRISVLAVCISTTAFAMPNPDTRFRPGANHHLGDDSFVAREGRAPTDADTERARMRVHLEHVRAYLGARPPTSPELADRRAELLGYLDDYIAKGITPKNAHLPWRTAVFIDDAGAICAVGYLIERSVGRALPEKIASLHRYDFLEDIAAAMPEVDAWIRTSGFTLEELASIQPAYESPNIMTWRTWDLVNHAPPDGPYDKRGVAGTFRKKSMHGTWTVKSEEGVVVGVGKLRRGNGAWTSFYPDGKRKLAEGPYVNNVAHGAWTLYHASGAVAAEGKFERGMRAGRWRFYNDTPGKNDKTLLVAGAFADGGGVTGRWKHFDDTGELLAITYTQGRGDRVDVVANADGVVHEHHNFLHSLNGPVEEYGQHLERFALGDQQIYVHASAYHAEAIEQIIYDADGHKLERTAEGWRAADCGWSKKRVNAARRGELAWLHEMLFNETIGRALDYKGEERYPEVVFDKGPTCGKPVAVSAERGALIDKLLAPRTAMRAQTPTFVREMVLGDPEDADAKDLRRLLAAYTIGYVEWPHVDGRFETLFKTMAGRISWEWHSSDPEADDTNPLENAR